MKRFILMMLSLVPFYAYAGFVFEDDESQKPKQEQVAKAEAPKPVAPPVVEPKGLAAAEPVTVGAKKKFFIRKGDRIDLSLENLARSQGWEFLWYPSISWKAISDIDLSKYKDASEAVVDVINGLTQEGKPLKWRISDGNKVIEIFSTEVKHD